MVSDRGDRPGPQAAGRMAVAAADDTRDSGRAAAALVDERAAREVAAARPSADALPDPGQDAAAAVDADPHQGRPPAAARPVRACSGSRLRPPAAVAPVDGRGSAGAGRQAEPVPSWGPRPGVESLAARHVLWGRPHPFGRRPDGPKRVSQRSGRPGLAPGVSAASRRRATLVRWPPPAVPVEARQVPVSRSARVRRRPAQVPRPRPARARRALPGRRAAESPRAPVQE